MTAELILYACPHGELAGQINHYFTIARRLCRWNPAHDYMPHCSLTGFFHDSLGSIPGYVAALETALADNRTALDGPVIQVQNLLLRPDFHGLALSSPWLLGLTAAFVFRAPSSSRIDRLRPQHWLHVSLSYGFSESEHESLAAIARRTVKVNSPVFWWRASSICVCWRGITAGASVGCYSRGGEAIARQKQCIKLEVTASNDRLTAQRFYARNGMKQTHKYFGKDL